MKKTLFILLALIVATSSAFAAPARPGTYKYTQPDGTVVVLQNHGDEYYHWTTDARGRVVEMDDDGYYRPVSISQAELKARRAKAIARARAWSSYDHPYATNFGDRKVLCIIAEFQPTKSGNKVLFDGKFVVENPRQHFSDMLNKQGYSENGAIGSVRDYYVENSMNQYRPSFDVYGPVTLSHDSRYYDNNGVTEAIIEAYGMLSDQIDIGQYDTDDNGFVDMILFYYPGYNEAEQGPSWTIWPHQGSTTGSYGNLGGKSFNRYFCTSELQGNSGAEPAAIGTTCHEFAHSLGLPDFYDVGDDENGGENSIENCTFEYDLMCYGSYNDNGRRPPYLTSLERNMLGWMPMPSAITSSGGQTLEGVQNNTAFRIDGKKSGEFFLLECRDQTGWDSGTSAAGLVVFQVDQSSRSVASGVTAASLWANTNSINAYGGHPCYRIVPSKTPIQYYDDFVFPGRSVSTYTPVDWDGNSTGVTLTGIAFSGSKVSFGVSTGGNRMIFGYVTDAFGAPVSDATVYLSKSHYAFAAPARLSTDVVVTTDKNGYYSFDLPDDASEYQIVKVRKDGYISRAENVYAVSLFNQQDFVMIQRGQDMQADLIKFDEELDMYGVNLSENTAVGMVYTAAELAEMGAVGADLDVVIFAGCMEEGSYDSVYVVVDIDGGASVRKDVTSQYEAYTYISVDMSEDHIVIPPGKDVFIGFGYTGDAGDYEYLITGPRTSSSGGNYYMEDFLNSSDLSQAIFGSSSQYEYYDFLVAASLSREVANDFASYGISYITLVDGVPQVVPAAGKTVYQVSWYLDGTPVNGEPGATDTLSKGTHTYMARVTHYDGTSERVYYDVVIE